MTSVLVIGSTGKTGRELVSTLTSTGDATVRAAVRNLQPAGQHGAAVPVHFDWMDEATWPAAADGAKAIYIVKPKTADPAQTVGAFLRVCKHAGKIVLLSEIAAERQEASADELRVEKVLEAGPCAFTILRPNWFMQNFATPAFFGDSIRTNHSVTVPAGGKSVSFVDTRDIAEVAAAALMSGNHDGKHYTLTGPDALTFADALDMIGAAAGYPVEHVDPPLEEYLETLVDKGADRSVADYLGRVYRNIQGGWDSIVTNHVEEVLGKKPRSFSAFVKENRSAWV